MGFEGSFSDVLPYDHFETDNVQIYNAWHRKDGISQRTYFRSLIEDCRAQRSLFSNCKLTFTKRASNIAADKLASFFFFFVQRMYWAEEYPHQIASAILTDVQNSISNE